ncbi:hypothetical protein J6590_022830 [Homalodisca vitripennis]|nr:hypothetical protein J6590_022830 [Homalodisca vitripennis]
MENNSKELYALLEMYNSDSASDNPELVVFPQKKKRLTKHRYSDLHTVLSKVEQESVELKTIVYLGCFSFIDISAGQKVLPKPALMAGGTRILGGGVGKTRKYNKAMHQLNGRRDSAITLSTRPLDFDLCLRMGRGLR